MAPILADIMMSCYWPELAKTTGSLESKDDWQLGEQRRLAASRADGHGGERDQVGRSLS